MPAVKLLSPSTVAAESLGFTLTVTGTGFISSSTIEWNGAALATSFASSTQLQAQVPSSDLATAATVSITVSSPAPGGGTSNNVNFVISTVTTNLNVLDVEGNDVEWDPQHQKLYVSVPSAATANASSIVIVDPIAGAVVSSKTTNSDPGVLASSDDGQFLYATISGDSAVQRFTLPTLKPDIEFTVGTDPTFSNPYVPTDIRVMPGAAHTIAVARSMQLGGEANIAVYDDAVARPNSACGLSTFCGFLQWSPDGSTIYSEANSSPTSFDVFTVNSGGVSRQREYGGVFRGWSTRLHMDPGGQFLYTDSGEVVNPTTALPVGNYPAGMPGRNTYAGMLAAVDSSLGRVFFLTPIFGSGQNSFQIQVFDQAHFTLLGSFVIPNAIGTPVNFIRWGQAGLAFVTNGTATGNPSAGKLYIIDGIFVNPNSVPDTSAGTAMNPVPTLSVLSPLSATVGDGATVMTITGRDFVGQPTVLWNGNALPTTAMSSNQVQATIPAVDLAIASQAVITVTNPSSGAGVSNPLAFSVNPSITTGSQLTVYPVGGNDLAWNAQAQTLYVSVPSIQGDLGNTIVAVDPLAGTVNPSQFIGSEPARLAVSSDDSFLYVGMNGKNSIQRLTLPGLTPDISWHLGADSFDGPYFALDIGAAPLVPHTTAVDLANFDVSPSSIGVAIYDDSTARPTEALSSNSGGVEFASIQWGNDASAIYASAQYFPTDFFIFGVTSAGVSVTQKYAGALQFQSSDLDIHYDPGTGLVYSDGGQVLDPTNGNIVGNFGASGIAVPDSTLKRVFFLGQTQAQTGTGNYTIQAFDQQNFTLLDSITIPNVVGSPTALVRWGTDGLAFTSRVGAPIDFYNIGPGQLYVINGMVVNPAAHAQKPVNGRSAERVRKTWTSVSATTRKRGMLLGPVVPATR